MKPRLCDVDNQLIPTHQPNNFKKNMVVRAFWAAVTGLTQRAIAQKRGESALVSLRGLGFTKPHLWRSRNGLGDIDANIHMNNASFVYNAELARWNLAGANGLLAAVARNKWQLMVGGQAFRYRRAIPPFARYQIWTEIESMDDQWLFITQTFTSPTKRSNQKPKIMYAQGTVRAIVVPMEKNKGKISPIAVMDELGIPRSESEILVHPTEHPQAKSFLLWDEATDIKMKQFTK